MNKADKSPDDRFRSKLSLLAETLAAGLHSLAQPLTRAQWSLEMAIAQGQSVESLRESMCDSLSAIEDAVGVLDYLRYIASPFRNSTVFEHVSIKDVLSTAIKDQEDAFKHENIEVSVEAEGDATILTVRPLAERIFSSLMNLLRMIAPASAHITLRDCREDISVQFAVTLRPDSHSRASQSRLLSNIRAYVEVLGGELSIASDCASLAITLPKSPDYIGNDPSKNQ